jgi:cell division septum initiation protein DivIVA
MGRDEPTVRSQDVQRSYRMSDFERPGVTFDQPEKRRHAGAWFGGLGEKLARSFNNQANPATPGRPQEQQQEPPPPAWEMYEDEYEDETGVDEATEAWEPAGRRFPGALHGYDRDSVDQHLAALEHELDQLRVQRSPGGAVEAEIDRIGEETSAIIKVAHEQATEITRRAQIQAEKCVADAAANAVGMTEEAKRKLRSLDVETDTVWAERARLLEDARKVATALFNLVEEAAERFPEEGAKTDSLPSSRELSAGAAVRPATAAANSGKPPTGSSGSPPANSGTPLAGSNGPPPANPGTPSGNAGAPSGNAGAPANTAAPPPGWSGPAGNSIPPPGAPPV